MQKLKDTISERPAPLSFIASTALKISSVIGNLWKGSSDRAAASVRGTQVSYAPTQKQSTHSAIIDLLNQGKHYDQAEQIVNVTEDYQLQLAALNTNKVQVFGKSVWIDLED